jgi:hypothetical protein
MHFMRFCSRRERRSKLLLANKTSKHRTNPYERFIFSTRIRFIPEALDALTRAQSSFSLHCACAAFAYLAQAHLSLNDESSAQVALDQANSILTRLQESHGEDLGELWFRLRLCELAVEEAWRMTQSL